MGDRKQARDEEFQSFVIGRWPRLMLCLAPKGTEYKTAEVVE
ncbi:hypothetical protein [Streptomyces sp. NPDC003015]